MSGELRLNGFERCLTLFTRVRPGEGRAVGALILQAFTLMFAYYLIRPVREALILTEGTAELRSYAVGAQALLLIVLIPLYSLLVRRVASNRVFQFVIAFFALNLVGFFLAGQAGWRFSFVFFVWASIFAVMAVAQFWAFATDLFELNCGTRLFGVIAVGVARRRLGRRERGGGRVRGNRSLWADARVRRRAVHRDLSQRACPSMRAGCIARVPRPDLAPASGPAAQLGRTVARRHCRDWPQPLPHRNRRARRAAELDHLDG